MNNLNPSFTSFKDAIIEAIPIFIRYKNKKNQGSAWLGKKVFLGFSKDKGWKVYELGFFSQIFRKLQWCYQDTYRDNILTKLEDLTFEEADFISKSKLTNQFPKLKQKIKEVYERKNLEINTLSLSSNQKNEEPLLLVDTFEKSETSKKIEIDRCETESQHTDTEDLDFPQATAPLYLNNFKGTRCYIDSVLELMLSQDSIREKIFEQALRNDLSNEKKEVLKTLRDLILIAHETKGEGKGDKSSFGENSPAERIRRAIFASKLNPDLSDFNDIYTQQDAASILLLINDLLDNSFQTVEIDTGKYQDKKIVTKRPVAINHKFELRFKNEEKNKNQKTDLNTLISNSFKPEFATDRRNEKVTRKFQLSNGDEIDSFYVTQMKLMNLPDLLPLHVNRYKFDPQKGPTKENTLVALPQDGIIDMTPYYSDKSGNSYIYEMTGYVIHHGASLTSGHYTANVKIGDRFYECNDLNPNFHKEITAKEFYQNENAYLVMLKRIPVPSP